MVNSALKTLTLTLPDDWHLHLRDGSALSRTVKDTAKQFARAIVMPNLSPPVTTTEMAMAYYQRILAAVPQGNPFLPLMTLYLTDNTTSDEIQRAVDSGIVKAVKLYPAGATTNSAAGVTDLKKCAKALEKLQQLGMPLLIHGEVTTQDIDIFDREKRFIEQHLIPLVADYPELKVGLEHITTADAAHFVADASANIVATITPHHLLYNRNHLLAGGIRPHFYCLPILKRNTHQQALIKAATSGSSKFFLGTDSAPHTQSSKESSCGCAGIYSAHAAIELYAEVFEQAGALDKLEAFASFYGADFYGLPRNQQTITLRKHDWQVANALEFGDEQVIPLRAGEWIHWQIVSRS